REMLILRKKAVAGMHRVGAARFCGFDDGLDIEIGFCRQRLADPHRLIGFAHMQRVAVSVGIDRDHAIAEPARGAHDAQRDLAAIGDQYFRERTLAGNRAHGRATENCMRCGVRASASRQIASTSESTTRVSRGSITPSSSTRALVENTSICPSNTPVICAFMASSFSFSIGLPRRAAAASVTIAMVSAACSPPIT